MNITVTVDEVTLSTVVAEAVGYDEDGDLVVQGDKTVAHLVAEQIVERLTRDDRWPTLREQVTELRKDEIRAAVRPAIDEALNRPIFKTNQYGERTSSETTLSELISDETRKSLTEPANRYQSSDGTVLQHAIRAEVKRVVAEQIGETVQKLAAEAVAELTAAAKGELAAAISAARDNTPNDEGDETP
jgi:hypothetical protein